MSARLHCFGESGNAYKAALTLTLAGIDWQPVFVDFFNGAARSDAYRRDLNEMGEVPVLESGDLRLTQSGAIMLWASEISGSLGGADGEAGVGVGAGPGWWLVRAGDDS